MKAAPFDSSRRQKRDQIVTIQDERCRKLFHVGLIVDQSRNQTQMTARPAREEAA